MPRAAYRGGDRDEYRAYEEVARDLLGPRGRVVEHVAREELVEDIEPEQPEESQRRPVLDQIMTEIDRRVLDVEMTFGVEDVLGMGCFDKRCFVHALARRMTNPFPIASMLRILLSDGFVT